MTYPLWYKGALMYTDRIDLSLPTEDFQSVLEAFASAAATLQQLPSVSPSDRKHYAKLGLKNEALTLQIIEVGRTHRQLIPAGMDFGKIDRDLAAREQLRVLKLLLQNLLDRVSDSMLLTGVDLYAAALSMYHCLRRNADTAGLKSAVAELKKGFARPSRKKKEQQEQPSAAALSPAVVPAAVNNPASAPEPQAQTPCQQPVVPEVTRIQITPHCEPPLPPESLHAQQPGATTTFLLPCHVHPVFFSGGFLPSYPEPGDPGRIQVRSINLLKAGNLEVVSRLAAPNIDRTHTYH